VAFSTTCIVPGLAYFLRAWNRNYVCFLMCNRCLLLEFAICFCILPLLSHSSENVSICQLFSAFILSSLYHEE